MAGIPEIRVPHDVEAAFVGYLGGLGYSVSTRVPSKRQPGMIRLTRSGGSLGRDAILDNPQLLVEVWGKDQADSWDRAIALYADLMRAAYLGEPASIGITHMQPEPPVTFEDEYAPELHRHIMNVSIVCHLTTLEAK